MQFIHHFVLRLTRDASTAEDITHDVFLKAFRKLHQFRGDANIRTWLYRIALNHCRNVMQSWHHRNVYYDADYDEGVSGSASENPLRTLEIKELGSRIQQTLDSLPEEYRVLLLMVANEKLSYGDVGELTGQSADAVRGKLYRARKAFTRAFQQIESTP